MRALLFLALILTACSQKEPDRDPAIGNWRGEGRDRLCIAGGEGQGLRGGLVVYGADDANCTAAGPVERTGDGLTLIPAGDPDCRIAIGEGGDGLTLGPRGANCAYYCGPGADYAGRRFVRDTAAAPATDLAGDALC